MYNIYHFGSWVLTFRGIEGTEYFQVLHFWTLEYKNYMLEKELPNIELTSVEQ